MLKIILTALAFSLLVSCQNNKASDPNTADADKPGAIAMDQKKDSAAIRQQVMAFYQWYVENETRFREFNLYKGINKKDAPPYKIVWTEVDRLQAFLRGNAPWLGEEFLKNQKLFLQQADSAFKVDLEDEIPYGFDYDWYTNSQEDPKYLLDEINKAWRWVITVNGDNAIADIKTIFDDNGTQLENSLIRLAMKRENGTWKIARIGVD